MMGDGTAYEGFYYCNNTEEPVTGKRFGGEARQTLEPMGSHCKINNNNNNKKTQEK